MSKQEERTQKNAQLSLLLCGCASLITLDWLWLHGTLWFWLPVIVIVLIGVVTYLRHFRPTQKF